MSIPVRIRDDVAAQVGVVAERERRSLANMVEVLLLVALEEREISASADYGNGRVATAATVSRPSSASDQAALTERGGARPVGGAGKHLAGPEDASAPTSAPRSVSAAEIADSVPGVRIASSVCRVCPPGRSRPSCSLPAKHDGKHSWEVH